MSQQNNQQKQPSCTYICSRQNLTSTLELSLSTNTKWPALHHKNYHTETLWWVWLAEWCTYTHTHFIRHPKSKIFNFVLILSYFFAFVRKFQTQMKCSLCVWYLACCMERMTYSTCQLLWCVTRLKYNKDVQSTILLLRMATADTKKLSSPNGTKLKWVRTEL